MGMFDYVHYQGKQYQSKDTPNQLMDKYKIETDETSGQDTLWVQEYDTEYVEEPELWMKGYFKEINQRWVRLEDFDGLIKFYRQGEDKKSWINYKALFFALQANSHLFIIFFLEYTTIAYHNENKSIEL